MPSLQEILYICNNYYFCSELPMINTNYISPDRSNKIMPSSPQARRKHPDFHNSPNQPLPNAIEQRKEPQSPQHYYPQKMHSSKPLDASVEKEMNLESVVRELSDRVMRLTQKLGQHQTILIKITENSIESNKEECKKGGKGDPRQLDLLSQSLSKLRRDFEDYRAGNIATRQIEVKNQLFSQLIHKSEQRMRQQIQNTIGSIQGGGTGNAVLSDEKMSQIDRMIRKLQKNVSLNTTNIFGAFEKIQSLSSSLDGHVDLISAEFNKAYNKIVSFVNEKLSKSISESITKMTERMERIQLEPKVIHFAGMKPSTKKSEKQVSRAEYIQTLKAFDQEIIISEKTYFIDMEGYLLDQEYSYLLNKNDERIRLEQAQMKILRSSNLIS